MLRLLSRYPDIQTEFRGHVALIEGDVPDKAQLRFSQLIEAIVGKPAEVATTREGTKYIRGILGETEDFIKSLA